MPIKKVSKSPTRQQIVAYIEAVLFKGSNKKAAYLENVNPEISNVHSAIRTIEGRDDFKEIYKTLDTDNNLQAQEAAVRARRKYVQLIEKNLDKTTELLDEAGSTADKQQAIRLSNETIGSMSGINSGGDNEDGDGKRKQLKRSDSIVL